jgi:hypothetical protein
MSSATDGLMFRLSWITCTSSEAHFTSGRERFISVILLGTLLFTGAIHVPLASFIFHFSSTTSGSTFGNAGLFSFS